MTAHLSEKKGNVLPDFLHLNDLGCESVGGKVLFATDDFFAPAENLLKKQRPAYHADLFTEFGKWRDGWETRRKRIPGHDWCIIQLGVPGTIYGFEADTSYFAGNCAPQISIQAACLKPEEVPALPARGNRIGTAASDEELRIVKELLNHLSDLVAMVNGGVCVGYSDAQLGHPGNILGPGRAKSMKDGWETSRNLQRPPILKLGDKGILLVPGSEWAIFRLGHSGVITHIEIDTSHFKGNFPDTFKLEACILSTEEENEYNAQKWTLKQSPKWNTLVPATKLKPHTRHFFDGTAIKMLDVFTHVKLTFAPDGGVSRMRLWGFPRALPDMRK
ncbi:probable inactive allantoicase [Podarcis raffonei]|uniref:probable inactive allantoicase n=1 Tax=Podarcis raffonei TaxID=65483 RepID=UPI0023294A37|nr:probable inactive allantoicase [Podarcis raffonei]